jgi:hypothetical protein
MSTTTPNIGMSKPAAGDTDWASEVNGNWDKLDALLKVIDHTWEGDDTNDREIDLGDDYDYIAIWQEEPGAYNADHAALAYAFRSCYGDFYEHATSRCSHDAQGGVAYFFQGKMTGADADKIKLGSIGDSTRGFNQSGYTYRLLGRKFGYAK